MSQEPNLFNSTTPVVMAHPNLFQARAFGPKGKEKGEAKFSANFLLDPTSEDLKAMKAIAVAAAKGKWPGRDIKTLKFPFQSGDKIVDKKKQRLGDKYKGEADFQLGKVVVTARSKYQPRLSYIGNGRIVDLETPELIAANKGKFFFGAEVLYQLNFQPYEGAGENPDGVCVYLNMICATGKGTKIAGGGQSASQVFSGYAGKASVEDPTGGAGIEDMPSDEEDLISA